MRLLVVAIVLCVAQCQARDHKRQYLPPLPDEDLLPPKHNDTKTRYNDASQISYHAKVRGNKLNRRYTWDDLKADAKIFVLHKLEQFKKVFDGNGWVNLSRLAAAWIEWLKQEDGTEHSTIPYLPRT